MSVAATRIALLFTILLSVVSGPLPAQLPAADPPFIPTPERIVEEMLSLGRVAATDVVYDLGSGDGRLVIAAAQRGARGVGVEYDGSLVTASRETAADLGVSDRTEFHHENLFETDISDATVVMLYLGADFNLRLRPALLADLRPGSRIVSHAFHMGSWEPDSTMTIGDGPGRATVFFWVVPVVLDGFWSLEIEELGPVSLEFLQTFQVIAGSAGLGGAERVPIVDGRVRGEDVRFELLPPGAASPLRFRGTHSAGRISGVIEGPGGWAGRSWEAVRMSDPSLAPTP